MSELRMLSFNRTFIAGRVTKDPESKVLPNGSTLCKFGLAVTEYYRTKDGERKEDTNFFNVTCWNKLAEYAVKDIHKGDPLFIEGKTRNYEYENANGEKRYGSEVTAIKINQLAWHGSKKKEQEAAEVPSEETDDIPF